MKIRVKELLGPRTVKVMGSEPWLNSIYEAFTVPEDKSPPLLTALLELVPSDHKFVKITGEINFTPFVDCSRCGDLIPWKIYKKFETMHLQPANQPASREIELKKEELDPYYIEDGQIDLEALLNDQIHLAIPSKTVPEPDSSGCCGICHLEISTELVYVGSGCASEKVPNSPFAILKDLKDLKDE